MERGPYLGVQELQARLIAQIFSKKIPFPKKEELEKGFAEQRMIRNQIPQPQFPQNYVNQSEALADWLGVKPDYENMQNMQPELHHLMMNGFYDNAHFRLVGPGAKFDLALEQIKYANSRFPSAVLK